MEWRPGIPSWIEWWFKSDAAQISGDGMKLRHTQLLLCVKNASVGWICSMEYKKDTPLGCGFFGFI